MKFLTDETTVDKSLPFVRNLIACIVLGLVGVYLRFAEFPYSSIIADVIMLIAIFIMFMIVFAWLKVPADRKS